jgi:hypothetical protein
MKQLQLILTLSLVAGGSSCQQFSQKVVEPIPAPARETLIRPLSPEEKVYYILPAPERY